MSAANWVASEAQIGIQPIETYDTTQNHGLGKIIRAKHATYGDSELIYCQFPASTAFALGILVQWDKNFLVATVPAGSSSKNTGYAVGTLLTAVTSNTSIQYGWVHVRGVAPVLKTGVAVPPQSDLYMSATAGRVYVTASTGKQLVGARAANTATVIISTSTVSVHFNPAALQGK